MVTANFYLLVMGVSLYVLSRFAVVHQWVPVLQAGTVICIVAAAIIFLAALIRNAGAMAREVGKPVKVKSMPTQKVGRSAR